jgi:hypothetical protein
LVYEDKLESQYDDLKKYQDQIGDLHSALENAAYEIETMREYIESKEDEQLDTLEKLRLCERDRVAIESEYHKEEHRHIDYVASVGYDVHNLKEKLEEATKELLFTKDKLNSTKKSNNISQQIAKTNIESFEFKIGDLHRQNMNLKSEVKKHQKLLLDEAEKYSLLDARFCDLRIKYSNEISTWVGKYESLTQKMLRQDLLKGKQDGSMPDTAREPKQGLNMGDELQNTTNQLYFEWGDRGQDTFIGDYSETSEIEDKSFNLKDLNSEYKRHRTRVEGSRATRGVSKISNNNCDGEEIERSKDAEMEISTPLKADRLGSGDIGSGTKRRTPHKVTLGSSSIPLAQEYPGLSTFGDQPGFTSREVKLGMFDSGITSHRISRKVISDLNAGGDDRSNRNLSVDAQSTPNKLTDDRESSGYKSPLQKRRITADQVVFPRCNTSNMKRNPYFKQALDEIIQRSKCAVILGSQAFEPPMTPDGIKRTPKKRNASFNLPTTWDGRRNLNTSIVSPLNQSSGLEPGYLLGGHGFQNSWAKFQKDNWTQTDYLLECSKIDKNLSPLDWCPNNGLTIDGDGPNILLQDVFGDPEILELINTEAQAAAGKLAKICDAKVEKANLKYRELARSYKNDIEAYKVVKKKYDEKFLANILRIND